jgi:tetratricopeptide (TPR) repeat protein
MLIQRLKQLLPEPDLQLVVRALRVNPIFWEAAQQDELINRLTVRGGRSAGDWHPARIGLAQLELSFPYPLSIEDKDDLPVEIRNAATETVEALLTPAHSFQFGDDLSTAALAGLGLLYRWQILPEIEDRMLAAIPEGSQLWSAAFAIFYDLVEEKAELIAALLQREPTSHRKQHASAITIQMVACQPVDQTLIAEALLLGLEHLPGLERAAFIRQFDGGSPEAAATLARMLLETLPSQPDIESDPIQNMIDFTERIELLRIQGQYDQALPTLELLNQAAHQLQADLSAQIAQAAARNHDNTTAQAALQRINQIGELSGIETSLQTVLARITTGTLSLEKRPETEERNARPSDPLGVLLADLSQSVGQQNHPQAQQTASRLYDLVIQDLNSSRTSKHSLQADFLCTLLENLLELGWAEESRLIGLKSIQRYPNDIPLLALTGSALRAYGDYAKAAELLSIALTLAHDNTDIRRQMVQTCMEMGDWKQARREAEHLVTRSSHTEIQDHLLLAECHLQTGQFEEALETCQNALLVDETHAATYQMMAQAFLANGDRKRAQQHLSQAILHGPDNIPAWIELASLQRHLGETGKALETLRSADAVNGNNAEIHLHLGLVLQDQNQPAKALTAYNQAARFVNEATDQEIQRRIHIQLGHSLFSAGYLEEAAAVLDRGLLEHPGDPEIAHSAGKVFLAQDKPDLAIPPLQLALQHNPEDTTLRLDLAEALLQQGKSPAEALKLVNQVLDDDPRNEQARILLAAGTAAVGKYHAALELYKEALQTELSQDEKNYIPLVTGIARTALRTDQPQVAVTFLLEGLRRVPHNLELKKELCQAYFLANLKQDALTTLLEIRSTASPDLRNLLWMADQAIALKSLELAIDLLTQAFEIAPRNAEIIVRLGFVHLESGETVLARNTFSLLFEADEVELSDMKLAAHALIGLGDAATSIPFIEKALEFCQYQSEDLLTELTRLYLEAGQNLAALDTIQRHLSLSPADSSLWLNKARILELVGRRETALEALEEAIRLKPADPDLRIQASRFLREAGQLAQAMEHLEAAVTADPDSLPIRYAAAHLSRACLQDNQALEHLALVSETSNTPEHLQLKLELLLESERSTDHEHGRQLSQQLMEIAPDNAAKSAILARLHALEGRPIQADETYQNAANLYQEHPSSLNDAEHVDLCLSLGEAALLMCRWTQALEWGQQAVSLGKTEPRPFRFLAKVLVMQAEYLHTCRAVQVTTRSPGAEAVSAASLETFNTAILSMYELTPFAEQAGEILKWEQRGNYALANQPPHQKPQLQSPNDLASLLAAGRRNEVSIDLDHMPKEWLDAVQVNFQRSLNLSLANLDAAYQLAFDLVMQNSRDPILLAFHAQMARRTGDLEIAYQQISTALSIWPDESKWLIFAAEIAKQTLRHEARIDHLESALTLSPEETAIKFELAEAYLHRNLPGNAIRLLEQATAETPLKPEYWSRLAEAFQAVGELTQATSAIEKATKLAPDKPAYLIQAAEIAYAQDARILGDRMVQKVIEANPTSQKEILALTNLLIHRKDEKRALKVLDDLIDLSVSPVQLQLQRAALIGQIEGDETELEILLDLARSMPKDPRVFSRLAEAFVRLNRTDEAVKAARYALKNTGDLLPVIDQCKLHYLLGILFQKAGQLDQSLEQLSIAVQTMPNFIEAYLEISNTLLARREIARALQYLEKAIQVSSNDPRPYLQAGLLLKEAKDYIGAEAMLKHASTLAPQDPNIKRHLAGVIAMAIIHQNEQE